MQCTGVVVLLIDLGGGGHRSPALARQLGFALDYRSVVKSRTQVDLYCCPVQWRGLPPSHLQYRAIGGNGLLQQHSIVDDKSVLGKSARKVECGVGPVRRIAFVRVKSWCSA